eukprot:GFUD01007997.1.p1 GENE.GFUD01007997.1~~GFUD01007997.1.p1  ORF type:complete len:375 (-),score=92.45 GFUD01007997.1:75-1199(-)
MALFQSQATDYTWCYTGPEPDATAVFQWTIDNFLSRTDEILESDTFKVKDERFRLKIHKGMKDEKKNEENKKILGIYLQLASSKYHPTNCTVSCRFDMSSASKQIGFKKFERLELILEAGNEWVGRGINISSLELLKKYLLNDQFTISASVILHGKDKQRSSKHSVANVSIRTNAAKEVGEHLWNSFQNKMYCDFTLISNDGKVFPCHKIILASRSPVMQRMMESGMIETKKQQLEIKNYDSDIVDVILDFMYKGDIQRDTLKSIAEQIFMAANFFQMTTLKTLTELALIEQMNTKNMLQRFLMADMHDAKELRLASKNLIIENSEALLKDEDWKLRIYESHDEKLIYEILEGIVLGGRQNKGVKRKHEDDYSC